MIYRHGSGIHDSIEVVSLYAMPNIGAEYIRDDIKATRWTGDYPKCRVCGRTHGTFAVHHEPPRSKSSLLLMTDVGRFVVKPSLVLLCTECHRDRHDRAELSFRWKWDSERDMERFLSGWFFAHGYAEHDERFWSHGRAVVEFRGERWEVRG